MTQTEAILKHLKGGAEITPIDALAYYGCFRLAARISELRKDGHSIDMEYVNNGKGKKFASYKLRKK